MTFLDIARAGVLPQRVPDRIRAAARLRASVWSRGTFALTVACLFAFVALAYARWQVDDAVVPWDSKNQFYAFFRFLADALHHGTVPLWNPYHFGGYPAVADPQSLIFTPTMLVFALIAPDASMQVFDAVIMLHLFIGSVGVLGLARRWRWHPPAGVLAALVFALGGVASSRLQHTGMIISYSWFPVALWSFQAALDGRSLRLACVAGLVAAAMAIGRDQVAFLLCLALAGAVPRQAFRSGAIFAYLRTRLPVLVCAGLVTLACMIVPILLTMQLLHDSNRPGIAYGMALEGSLDPINLLTFFAPNVFGSLDTLKDYWGPGAATPAGNDWTDRSIDYLFAGTLPAVLFVWHGLAGGRLMERGARYFMLLFVAATLYALGRHTPAFGLAFDWMPGVSLYRRPADATFVMNVAFAFCAGYILHRFIEEGLPRFALLRLSGWILPALTLVGAALLIASGLTFAQSAEGLGDSVEQILLSGGIAAAVIATLFVFRARERRALLATVLVGLTGAQLLWRNAASPLNAEPISAYSPYSGLFPDEANGLGMLRAELARREAAGDHPRVEILGLDGAWQNASMVFKIQDTLGYNPLRIAEYERAGGVAESANDAKLRNFPDTFRGYNSRLATLLGLEYLLLDRPIADMPRAFPRPRASLLFRGVQFYLYRIDNTVVPRVYVASRVVPIESHSVVEGGTMPDFEIGREALIDRNEVGLLRDKALASTAASIDGSEATITDYADDHVRISVDAARPGILVLHDIYYPGWTAAVDGIETPVLRTNLIFRGIEVPAGHHTVEFSFHPFSLRNLMAAAGGLWTRDRE